MTKHAPILADAKTAAAMLCLTTREFLALVQAGHLPKGIDLAPGIVRWDTDAFRKIADGRSVEGSIEW